MEPILYLHTIHVKITLELVVSDAFKASHGIPYGLESFYCCSVIHHSNGESESVPPNHLPISNELNCNESCHNVYGQFGGLHLLKHLYPIKAFTGIHSSAMSLPENKAATGASIQ